jgi:transcriptional regulator with XRE-family HTH domain
MSPTGRRSSAERRREMREAGKRIKEVRERRGLTQDELGELLGVVSRTVSAYERGERLDWRVLPEIGEALGEDPIWLANGKRYESRLDQLEERLAQRIEKVVEDTLPRANG